MARISIDNTLFTDSRFTTLMVKIGSAEAALGAVVMLWIVAQEYWKRDYGLISENTWKKKKLNNLLLEVGLAEKRDGGIYAAGSKKNFAWLFQKVEAGKSGGKKSAEMRRSNSGKLVSSGATAARSGSKRDEAARSGAKRGQAASSGSNPSSSSSSSASSSSASTTSKEVRSIAADAAHPSGDGPLPPLVMVWNSHRGRLPEARSWNGPRLKKIKLRWPEQSPEAWVATVQRMAASDFCCGKGSTGWRADFDFLLKPDTWAKVNEGKYDNNKGAISTAQTRKYDKLDELEEKWKSKEV